MSGSFRASGLGSCRRAQVMSYYGVPSVVSPQLQKIFDEGHRIHNYMQGVLTAIGVMKDCEVEYVDPALRLTAHTDGINQCPENLMGSLPRELVYDGEVYMLEIKSAGSGHFFAPREFHLYERYRMQFNAYMHMSGIHKGLMMYVSKSTPGLCSGLFNPDDLHNPDKFKLIKVEYDPVRWQIVEQDIMQMIPYVDSGKLYPIQYGSTKECQKCLYAGACRN